MFDRIIVNKGWLVMANFVRVQEKEEKKSTYKNIHIQNERRGACSLKNKFC